MELHEVAAFWEGNAETWTRQTRAGYDVYRDALNTPAFLDMLPDVTELCGLDIGCGEGANTRKVAGLGAKMTGIDVAPTFIRHAAEAGGDIAYQVADAHALPFADKSFDFATAFMSLMDMPKPEQAIAEAARVLKPGGFLQFSILHPCFAPPYRKTHRHADGTTRAVELARYFETTDGEVDRWWFSSTSSEERASTPQFQIPRFHRPLYAWVDMIVAAGLTIEKLGEPMASEDAARTHPIVEDTRVVPIFMHVRARKR